MLLTIYTIVIMTFVIAVMGGFVWYLALEFERNHRPYNLFEKHVQNVLKGKCSVKREQNRCIVTSTFVDVTVKEYEKFSGEKGFKFLVYSGSQELFECFYHTEKDAFEDFECSEVFAEGANQCDFPSLLRTYIPYILQQAYGGKSERLQVIEKMEQQEEVSNHALPLSLPKDMSDMGEFLKKIAPMVNDVALNLQQPDSSEMKELMENIQRIALTIQQGENVLDAFNQHDFDNLIYKRIPNVLNYVKGNENEVKVALEEAYKKLLEWQNSLEGATNNGFQKELLLMREITKR